MQGLFSAKFCSGLDWGGGGGGAHAPSYNMNALGTGSEGAQYDSFVFPF